MLLTGEKKPGDSLQKKCMVPGLNGAEFTLESLCVSARLQDTPSGTTKNKIQALRHARAVTKPVIPPDNTEEQQSAQSADSLSMSLSHAKTFQILLFVISKFYSMTKKN
jgi:hypothetical protein